MEYLQGLNKTTALELLKTKEEWSQKEVRVIISSLKLATECVPIITVKIGDVVKTRLNHLAVVFKIKNNIVYSVLITTEENTFGILVKSHSRFYPGCFLTSTVVTESVVNTTSRIVNLYDCSKDITTLKSKLKEFYKNVI